jgi:hypothetical protein
MVKWKEYALFLVRKSFLRIVVRRFDAIICGFKLIIFVATFLS